MKKLLVVAMSLSFCAQTGCANDDKDTSRSEEAAEGDSGRSAKAHDAGLPAEELSVRILYPEPGDVLTGLADVELELSVPSGDVTTYFGVDEAEEVRQLAQRMQIKTANLEDGEHTLIVRIEAEDGEIVEDEVEVVFDNPDFELTSYRVSESDYANGEEVVIDMSFSDDELNLSLDGSTLDDEFEAEDVSIEDLGDGDYQLRYIISSDNSVDDGIREAWVTATNADDESKRYGVPVRLRNVPLIPLLLSRGALVDQPAPAPPLVDEGDAPMIVDVNGDPAILNGSSVKLSVTYVQPAGTVADKLLLSVPGFSGYYAIPLEPEDTEDEQTIELEVSLPQMQPSFFEDFDSLPIDLTIIDAIGRAVLFASHTLSALNAGDNFVGGTLVWDSAADLDIAIVDPNGNLIDFETPEVGTGALQLDSNALCEEGTRVENISWPLGEAPIGKYTVLINVFDACGAENTNWTLTTNFCGEKGFTSGSVTPSDVDQMGTGTAQAEFEVDCTHVIRGKATFEKKNTIRPAGTTAAGTPTPINFAPLRVMNADNDALIKEVTTRPDGSFVVAFLNSTDTSFYLQVEASWSDPSFVGRIRHARVNPLASEDPYTSDTVALDGARNPNALEIDVHVTDQNNAGAFNIRDIMLKSYTWVNGMTPTHIAGRIGPAVGRWSRRTPTILPGSKRELSFYQAGTGPGQGLFISGSLNRQTEWSDSVVAHEFFHHVVAQANLAPGAPGGPHSGRAAPALAWSEGLPTALGQVVLGSPRYVTEQQNQLWSINIDTGMEGFRRDTNTTRATLPEVARSTISGTSGGKQTDNVDEFLISMLLYDILDSNAAAEPHDKFTTDAHRRFGADMLFNHASGMSFADRDSNGVDLVDFIDRFRSMGSNSMDNRLVCLTKERAFPYDHFQSLTCMP